LILQSIGSVEALCIGRTNAHFSRDLNLKPFDLQ
jgi:hypothetical protein